ncbi:MAG: HD domain-containing protein [Spirochaetaceae bacterium]|nr:HD domain-containing protein [Spirochaetaceae bacterium]
MPEKEIIAVIDIGSSAMRLLIAQADGKGDWDLLDSAEQPLALGKDVFRNGFIERQTMNRAVKILQGFQELMSPYGVGRVVAIGTSALRESENREMFVDRVMLQTGIEIRVVDGVEANQLTWLAVREPLEESITGFNRSNALIIEVGAGNTDLMILHQGKISNVHALPIGTLRFLQKLKGSYDGNLEGVREFFRNQATRTVKAMSHEIGLSRVSKLVAIGSDARLVASRLGRKISDDISVIPRDAFRAFMKEIEELSPEQVISKLDLPWNEAELLYPAMVIFDTFVGSTRADEILVPSASIRQGLLVNYAASRTALREIFGTQVLAGCRSLAKHYHVDMRHAEFVRKQALRIYEAMNTELGLGGYHKLFLEAAALLHDVGIFISATSHHKHGQYIVRNSDIFGLSSTDKEIVSHIVRYHRRAKPQRSHGLYMSLWRTDRTVVQKLSALLRIADALDRSHTQQIKIKKLGVKGDRLVIRTSYSGDLSLEEMSLKEKGDLFEDVFGLKAVLRYEG